MYYLVCSKPLTISHLHCGPNQGNYLMIICSMFVCLRSSQHSISAMDPLLREGPVSLEGVSYMPWNLCGNLFAVVKDVQGEKSSPVLIDVLSVMTTQAAVGITFWWSPPLLHICTAYYKTKCVTLIIKIPSSQHLKSNALL